MALLPGRPRGALGLPLVECPSGWGDDRDQGLGGPVVEALGPRRDPSRSARLRVFLRGIPE
jgi:hypothetical protein